MSTTSPTNDPQGETKEPTTPTGGSDTYLMDQLLRPYFVNAQGVLKRPEHLISFWRRIFSILGPSPIDRPKLRRLGRMFRDAVPWLPLEGYVHNPEGHTSEVRSVAFSPDGKFVVSGSDDNTVRMWRTDTGENVQTLEGHTGRVESVAFSPDGKYVVTGSIDKTVRIWHVESGQVVRQWE